MKWKQAGNGARRVTGISKKSSGVTSLPIISQKPRDIRKCCSGTRERKIKMTLHFTSFSFPSLTDFTVDFV